MMEAHERNRSAEQLQRQGHQGRPVGKILARSCFFGLVSSTRFSRLSAVPKSDPFGLQRLQDICDGPGCLDNGIS
jgi:hypothetical protein